jgi:uncharacterized protein YcbK (DUF882 family)
MLLAALAIVAIYRPPAGFGTATIAEASALIPPVKPALSAFGRSGAVSMKFTLPGGLVNYPLEVLGDPQSLGYSWIPLGGTELADTVRLLRASRVIAPPEPGFYRLALERNGVRRVLDAITVAVLVPFDLKQGPVLDGYRMGTYRGRAARDEAHPVGFVRVDSAAAQLPITEHLRVADFLTRDTQDQWPRYAAIDTRVLDKLELVLAALSDSSGDIEFDVHSAFRTPFYNSTINRFARDSRHMHGDAIDVAIDANGDGRLTSRDTRLVAAAVDRVEKQHPELAGGLGIYTSRKYREPFVHIDARGTRARWRG